MRGGEDTLTDKVKMSLGLKKKYSQCDDLVARTVLAVNEKHAKIIEKMNKQYQKSLERLTRKCDKRCRKMYKGSNHDDDSDSSDESDDLALFMAKLNPSGKAKGTKGYSKGNLLGYNDIPNLYQPAKMTRSNKVNFMGYNDNLNFPNWYQPTKTTRSNKVNSLYYGTNKTIAKVNVNFTIKTPTNQALTPTQAPKYIMDAIKQHINAFFEYLKKQIHVYSYTHPNTFVNRVTSVLQVYQKDRPSIDGYYRKYSITYPSVQYYKVTLSSITDHY
jgi:hypothetical protein